MRALLHHPHHPNRLPTTHRHQNPPNLPIPLQRIKRNPRQRTPHLKPRKPTLRRRTLRSRQNQTPQPHPGKLRMHEDRPHLRRIDGRIKPLRCNRLHLMIPAIQRPPKTPPAAPCQLPALSERNKITPIRNQPAIHREHRSQRPINLRRRIIPSLQPPHRSINQRTNPLHILRRRHTQTKRPHPQSIRARIAIVPPPTKPA
jgi:hypothetical protein